MTDWKETGKSAFLGTDETEPPPPSFEELVSGRSASGIFTLGFWTIALFAVAAGTCFAFLGGEEPENTREPSNNTLQTQEMLGPELSPVRPIPKRFTPDTHRPSSGEGATSGSVDPQRFSAGRDLVYIDDPRAWWESDHDGASDDEDDHSMHASLERPLRRTIEMVSARNATLKVQDAYRASGVHSPRSLHREGRAVDLTADGLSLEDLACICWAAGFDWVYYEASSKGGAHIHASVRR